MTALRLAGAGLLIAFVAWIPLPGAAAPAPPQTPVPEPPGETFSIPQVAGAIELAEARAWAQAGNWARAARILKAPAKETLNPNLAYAHLYCLYKAERYPALLTRIRRSPFGTAIASRPGAILLGLTHWRLGETAPALDAWVQALAHDPRDDRVWECIRVAVLSMDTREVGPMIAALQRAEAVPDFGKTFLLGMLEFRRGHVEKAEKLLVEARVAYPESVALTRGVRDYYRHLGNRKRALQYDELLRSLGDPAEAGKPASVENVEPPGTTLAPGADAMAYRLPWAGGETYFCGSHEDRAKTPHEGRGRYALDFLLPIATPVLAAREGLVVEVDDGSKPSALDDFATRIVIDHGDGTAARYFHVRGGTATVQPGDRVARGQPIAQSGRTGRCQARHLHFEVVRKAPWRFREPPLYSRVETIPVDFAETVGVDAATIPGRWLVSRNARAR